MGSKTLCTRATARGFCTRASALGVFFCTRAMARGLLYQSFGSWGVFVPGLRLSVFLYQSCGSRVVVRHRVDHRCCTRAAALGLWCGIVSTTVVVPELLLLGCGAASCRSPLLYESYGSWVTTTRGPQSSHTAMDNQRIHELGFTSTLKIN